MNDDKFPQAYPYSWSTDSELSLQEFLTKYKPSMVQDDGTKPWIWVRKSAPAKEDTNIDAATDEAKHLLNEVTEKVEAIKNDDSIPVRANKKKGTKSKKELREAVQSEATQKLKDISVKNGFISGKWLIFAPSDKVDLVWSTIANSLISGPLASTSAFSAKVATCPQNETPNYSHVLCLYIPDVYDQSEVVEIMKILLRKHGMNLMGVKSNLYTAIGLDSKHASGIPSTVWKNTMLLADTESKKLKEEFFAELGSAKSADADKAAAKTTLTKPKPKLKQKHDDPFASEDESDAKVEGKSEAAAAGPSSSKPQARFKKSEEDPFGSGSDNEDNEQENKKSRVAAKRVLEQKKGHASKRAKEDDEDEDGRRPKKRQVSKR